MANINLSQSTQRAKAAHKVGAADKGIYISLAVLVIMLLIFGALKMGTRWFDSKKASVESQISTESRNLEGKDVDKVADFQQRLNNIDSNISSKKDPNELLKQLGDTMIQGAVVNSMENISSSLVLEITTEDFLIAAKQVLGFKKSEYFGNVQISEISRDEDGKIIFTLSMNF